MVMRYLFYLLFILFGTKSFSQQILVDSNHTVTELVVNDFLKGGVTVSNISFKGSKGSIGLFKSDSDKFPVDEGIILSTGLVSSIVGPNHCFSTSFMNNTDGDSLLTLIAGGRTYDAAIIEFDFVPVSENVAFDFVFTSEEYPEYVDSQFNDVFAFLISSEDTDAILNIAYLPGTFQPITVNTVNHKTNSSYFIDNPAPSILYFMDNEIPGMEMKKKSKRRNDAMDAYNKSCVRCRTELCNLIQFDGFTKMLTAKAILIPEKKYHFKIAIADVNDKIFDSAVILKAHSFKSFDQFGNIYSSAQERKVERNKEITVELKKKKFDVLFAFDSALLNDSTNQILKTVASNFKRNTSGKIYISAHTDSKGSNAYNDRLAERRAGTVKQMLIKLGIDESKIVIETFGEKKPRYSNDDDSGRAGNRRAELIIEEN